MIALIFLGTKLRKIFPKGTTLTQFVQYKFGKNLFKLILVLMIFYMFIFLCAEVTAISMLINYISGTPLWVTATFVIRSNQYAPSPKNYTMFSSSSHSPWF